MFIALITVKKKLVDCPQIFTNRPINARREPQIFYAAPLHCSALQYLFKLLIFGIDQPDGSTNLPVFRIFWILFVSAGNDDNLFEINPMTGELIIIGELDHEKQPRHTIVVKATNNASFVPGSGGPYDPSIDITLKEIVISRDRCKWQPPCLPGLSDRYR